MNHNVVSRHHSASAGQSDATRMDDYRMAFAEMTTGIKVPPSIGWRIADAKRGRVKEPLGPYPAVADVIIDAGGSYHFVSRPLTKLLAHLRRRCNACSSKSLKDALMSAKKENDEAEAMALSLAFSGSVPSVSDLSSLSKELTEEIMAAEQAKELVEDRLVALTEGK